jgi:hypothetical protein
LTPPEAVRRIVPFKERARGAEPQRRPAGATVHEKRVHARVPIDVEVVCEVGDGTRFVGVAKDVSLGGMYIECSGNPQFGTELVVVGTLPASKAEMRFSAVVRWCKPDGIGVQFGLLGARETHAITEALKQRQP